MPIRRNFPLFLSEKPPPFEQVEKLMASLNVKVQDALLCPSMPTAYNWDNDYNRRVFDILFRLCGRSYRRQVLDPDGERYLTIIEAERFIRTLLKKGEVASIHNIFTLNNAIPGAINIPLRRTSQPKSPFVGFGAWPIS